MNTNLALVIITAIICVSAIIVYSINYYKDYKADERVNRIKEEREHFRSKYKALLEILSNVLNMKDDIGEYEALTNFYKKYIEY